jgi:hypothetical protein
MRTSHAAVRNLGNQAQALTSLATDDMIRRSKKRLLDRAAASKAPALSRQRITLIALCASLPVLAVLVSVTFFGDSLAETLSPPLSPQIVREQAQGDLDAAVKDIEAFRADFSTLPQTLTQIGVPTRGDWTYTKGSDGHYQVVRALHGQVLTFNSVQKKMVSDGK